MPDLHFFLASRAPSEQQQHRSAQHIPPPSPHHPTPIISSGNQACPWKWKQIPRWKLFWQKCSQQLFQKKKKKEPTSRLFSPFFLPAFCQSSIQQETTHFISVTHNDGLVLQPWLILRTSISQAESLNVPCLEGLLIWCRWTAQEELIHSLQQFFSDHYIM